MDGLEQRGRERDGGSEKEPERARVIEREGGGPTLGHLFKFSDISKITAHSHE